MTAGMKQKDRKLASVTDKELFHVSRAKWNRLFLPLPPQYSAVLSESSACWMFFEFDCNGTA